jgi:methylaspartate mutase sigma subunit
MSVIVTSLSSDAHTWNLVYLQLVLEELGCRVHNLGACTPTEKIMAECLATLPDLVVVSSVNGHGAQDGPRLIKAIRSCPDLATMPVVIGGKLDTEGGDSQAAAGLRMAGFDAVFGDTDRLTQFRALVRALAAGERAPVGLS